MWDRHVSPTGSIETLQLTSAGAFNLPPREKYPLLCRRLHGAVVSLPSKMTSTWGKSADVDMFFFVYFFFLSGFLPWHHSWFCQGRFGNSFHLSAGLVSLQRDMWDINRFNIEIAASASLLCDIDWDASGIHGLDVDFSFVSLGWLQENHETSWKPKESSALIAFSTHGWDFALDFPSNPDDIDLFQDCCASY